MNTKLTILIVPLLWPALLHSQQYAISWSKVSGGGITSSGGSYSVTGSIGQHDAGGPLNGATYSIHGGFWVLPILIQTPGGPALSIALGNPGQALVSWSQSPPGFILQETTSLEAPKWINTPGGTTGPVKVPAVGDRKYYRLQKQ